MYMVKNLLLNAYRIGYSCESIDSTLLQTEFREHTCLETGLADAFKINSVNITRSSIVHEIL